MVKVMTALLLALGLWGQGAAADDASLLQEAMRKNPDQFRTVAEDLIAGFGGPLGLMADGVEDHIALARAASRATAMRRLLAMDLDNSGSITRQELATTLRAASATARGRLERQFSAADANADDRIDAAEMRAEGQTAALRAVTEGEASTLRALLSLDADRNGALTLVELRQALLRLGEVT